MCRGWRFVEPQVPGAIAPVPATADMTQEVGIKNCRLYTKPGDAVVSEFEARLEAVEESTATNAEDIDELDSQLSTESGRIDTLETEAEAMGASLNQRVKYSDIEVNPDEAATDTMNKITYRGTTYSFAGGGSADMETGTGSVKDSNADTVGSIRWTRVGKKLSIMFTSMSGMMYASGTSFTITGLPASAAVYATHMQILDYQSASSAYIFGISLSKVANGDMVLSISGKVAALNWSGTDLSDASFTVVGAISPYYLQYLQRKVVDVIME